MLRFTQKINSLTHVLNLALVGFLLIFLTRCQQQKEKTHWLAKINGQVIHQDEFRQFYELDPNFGIDSVGLPALKAELDKMIDQKLALKLAQKEHLFDDPVIQKAIAWEKKQAMLRALYRKEIGAHLNITDADLRRAYLERNQTVRLRHLFTKDVNQAFSWFKKVRQDSSLFWPLAREAFRDSLLRRNGGDLGWVKLSELDEDLRKGIDTLRVGQISRPIKTRWGYHVVQLLNRKKPAIIREDDYLQQRPALEKWLRQEWGRAQARAYIQQTIGKLNPQPDRALFLKIWLIIKGDQNLENLQLPHPRILDERMLQKIKEQLPNALQAPFIRYQGGQVSLGQFLDLLNTIPLTQRPRFRTPHELSLQLAKIFRDDFLFKKAQKAHLERDEQVVQEVRRFKEEQLYYYFVNQIADTLSVPQQVAAYFKQKASDAVKKFPELKTFHTLQEWKWSRAEQILHRALRAMKPNIKVNEPLLRQENQRINWGRRIRMFMIRKPS